VLALIRGEVFQAPLATSFSENDWAICRIRLPAGLPTAAAYAIRGHNAAQPDQAGWTPRFTIHARNAAQPRAWPEME